MATGFSTERMKAGVAGALFLLLAACASGPGTRPGYAPVVTDPAPIVSGTMRPYQVRGRWYRPSEQPGYDETGLASWYGEQFNGRPTATGERFDMHALTAAHKTLPLPGLVEVTNTANGRRIVVRVNDRGPFVENRIIDLSRGSAEALGLLGAGVGEVRVRYLGRAPRLGGGTVLQYAEAAPPPAGPVPYLPAAPAVVVPAPARPASPVSEGAGVWVQAGVWPDAAQARRAASHLGGAATVDEAAPGQFRVLVGPWPDAGAAERSRRAVISRGYPGATMISGA